MLSISHPNGEESPLTEQKLASVDDDSEMLSDSTSDILSVDDVQNIRILNGFSLSQYKHLRKYKRPKGLPNEDTFVDGRSSASDKSSKSRRNTSTSSHSTDVMLDLPKSKEDVVPDVKLPNFEETIIEGFSIMAFQTSEEMEKVGGWFSANNPSRLKSPTSQASASVFCRFFPTTVTTRVQPLPASLPPSRPLCLPPPPLPLTYASPPPPPASESQHKLLKTNLSLTLSL
uniref:Protein TSSC4 n=1 Tax=Mesocestoides corti TaxID=53468 RepID=A0A5K3FFR6_MESCO